MKNLVTSLSIVIISSAAFANEYVLNRETMECRIGASNGIPALVQDGARKALIMDYKQNGISVNADYVSGDSVISLKYQDSVKLNSVDVLIPLVKSNAKGINATASTQLIFAGAATNIVCNVRTATSLIPIPAPPTLK